MTWFEVTDKSEAVVDASREQVWKLLTDPDALVRMTPFLQRIDVDGDHWTWQLGALKIVGKGIAPAFTEEMSFTECEKIVFRHDPPVGSNESAAVNGSYDLSDAPGGGTHLAIEFEIALRLPLPSMAKSAVNPTLKGIISKMGDGFARNLDRELAR